MDAVESSRLLHRGNQVLARLAGTGVSAALGVRVCDYVGSRRLFGRMRAEPDRRAQSAGQPGYWVRSSATGQGVATAAVALVRDWGFAKTNLVRMEVLIAVDNAASRRVADKAGAVYEGTLRRRLLVHGTRHDAAMYTFVR